VHLPIATRFSFLKENRNFSPKREGRLRSERSMIKSINVSLSARKQIKISELILYIAQLALPLYAIISVKR